MGAAGAVVSTVMVRVAMSDILPVPSSAENEPRSPLRAHKESVQLPSESATVVVASHAFRARNQNRRSWYR